MARPPLAAQEAPRYPQPQRHVGPFRRGPLLTHIQSTVRITQRPSARPHEHRRRSMRDRARPPPPLPDGSGSYYMLAGSASKHAPPHTIAAP